MSFPVKKLADIGYFRFFLFSKSAVNSDKISDPERLRSLHLVHCTSQRKITNRLSVFGYNNGICSRNSRCADCVIIHCGNAVVYHSVCDKWTYCVMGENDRIVTYTVNAFCIIDDIHNSVIPVTAARSDRYSAVKLLFCQGFYLVIPIGMYSDNDMSDLTVPEKSLCSPYKHRFPAEIKHLLWSVCTHS